MSERKHQNVPVEVFPFSFDIVHAISDLVLPDLPVSLFLGLPHGCGCGGSC